MWFGNKKNNPEIGQWLEQQKPEIKTELVKIADNKKIPFHEKVALLCELQNSLRDKSDTGLRIASHIHTKYSEHGLTIFDMIDDEEMSPANIVDYSKRIGFDMVAISDHDTYKGLDEAINRAEKIGGIQVIPSVEINVSDEKWKNKLGKFWGFFHLMALDIRNEDYIFGRKKIPFMESLEETIKKIKGEMGGLVGGPHLADDGSVKNDGSVTEVNPLSYSTTNGMVIKNHEKFDYVASLTLEGMDKETREIAERFGIAQMGESDAHALHQVGLVGTIIEGAKTRDDVRNAILKNKTTPYKLLNFPDELIKMMGTRFFPKMILY